MSRSLLKDLSRDKCTQDRSTLTQLSLVLIQGNLWGRQWGFQVPKAQEWDCNLVARWNGRCSWDQEQGVRCTEDQFLVARWEEVQCQADRCRASGSKAQWIFADRLCSLKRVFNFSRAEQWVRSSRWKFTGEVKKSSAVFVRRCGS